MRSTVCWRADLLPTSLWPAAMAEFPGISPMVFDFARRVAREGCTAVVPHLYGNPGRDPSPAAHGLVAAVANTAGQVGPICISRLLLPPDERIVALPQSALERSWMDRVDATDGVFITAEGLLMYLDPDDALALIRDCATRFPGGRMMFDSIPHWFSRRTLKGLKLSARYTVPPMPFSMTADEGVALADRIPGVRTARDVPLRPGRGAFKVMAWPPLDGIRFLRRIRPSMTLLEFGP
jgi:hypothetical protein